MDWTMHVEYRYESIKLRMPKASTGNIIAIRMFSTYSPANKLMASNRAHFDAIQLLLERLFLHST